MDWGTVVALAIVALAVFYTVFTFVRKYRRLSAPQKPSKIGPCGHACDHCPFAKYGDLGSCSRRNSKPKSGGCCCG